MQYKEWWNSDRHYKAVLQYLCGQSLELVCSKHREVCWKLQRIAHIPSLQAVNRLGNLIATVVSGNDLKLLKLLEPYAREVIESAGCEFVAVPENLPFVPYKERLVMGLRGTLAHALVSAVKEFPPVISVSDLYALFLGPKALSNRGYIEVVRKMQAYIPGGALGVFIPNWDKCVGDIDLWSALDKACEGWSYHGEFYGQPYPVFKTVATPITVLIDGENSPVDTIDWVLKGTLSELNLTNDTVIIYDSLPTKDMYYKLLEQMHPGIKIVRVPCAGRGKSQVDFYIRDEFSRQYYTENQRQFVIVSSDADYSSLIDSFPDARIYYFVQRSITSYLWIQRMETEKIPHLFLDESMHSWNIRVFYSEIVVRAAQVLSQEEIEDSSKWFKFVETMPKFDDIVFRQARQYLRQQRRNTCGRN